MNFIQGKDFHGASCLKNALAQPNLHSGWYYRASARIELGKAIAHNVHTLSLD